MERMNSREIFAMNLKYYRYKLKLSQEKFAEKLGSTLSYINQLENVRRKPTLELVDNFAKRLGISSSKLLTYNSKHVIKKIRIDSKKTK